MSRRSSRLFSGYVASKRDEPIIERKPVSHEFTPAQQMALVYLRKSELSRLVYAKLLHSTVCAGATAYRELEAMRFAERKSDGYHQLTFIGWCKANELTDELAKEFGITIPQYYTRRRGFPLGMSQAGNA